MTLAALAVLTIFGSALGVFPLATSVAGASALLVGFMSLLSASFAIGMTLFTIVVPREIRGVCLSTLAAGVSLFGAALAPVLVSALSTQLGGEAMIGRSLAAVCVPFTAFASIAFLSCRSAVLKRQRVLR